MASGQAEPRWPPRSPHEALLSSPTGRQKIRQYQDRTSPSPSPLKKSSTRVRLGQRTQDLDQNDHVDDEEDEDEETLQLQLAALEAKIKLKKLQQRKTKDTARSDGKVNRKRAASRPGGKENTQPLTKKLEISDGTSMAPSNSSIGVQIPVSPQRKRTNTHEVPSPGRVQLGIDKGLKGKNVTLRRPPEECTKNEDPFRMDARHGSASKLLSIHGPQKDVSSGSRSFSEKIAETRKLDKARKMEADKLRRQRSTGFGVNQGEINTFQAAAKPNSDDNARLRQPSTNEFSRDDIIRAKNKANGDGNRNNTSGGIRRSKATSSTDIWINPNAAPENPEPPKVRPNDRKKRLRSMSPPKANPDQSSKPTAPEVSDVLFEPFSSIHLSRRLLPHDILTRTLTEKHIFRLPDLLGIVKSPDYVLPDIAEPDYVILAVIASKSSPLSHKGGPQTTKNDNTSTNEAAESEQNNNGKYIVFTLTDMKWTVDLFLFSTGYTRFRKLTPGTVVALLNPDIMPPAPGKADTGRFSLKLSSNHDTVLEVGTSRDLGWCKSTRKDGKQCESWVDKRHTEFCEFHVDAVIERTRRGRMETQGMSAPFAPGGRKGGRTGHFGEKRRGRKADNHSETMRDGPQYDRGSGSRYFVAPSIPGQSAAQLLDAEGATDRYGSKEDRVRKRLAEREKENDIARKLGQGGNGAGSEYLRLKHGLGPAISASEPQAADPVDATSLGLLGNKAKNVQLSPIKRKRIGSGLDTEGSRKKTRFLTDAGIKEAGRESVGGKGIVSNMTAEEDDDGLEVV